MNAYFPVEQIDHSIPETSKRLIIDSAIRRWIKYKKSTSSSVRLYYFKKAVETEIRLARKRTHDYLILMFINADINSIEEFKKVELLGSELTYISWNDVEKMEIKNLWQIVYTHDRHSAILCHNMETKIPIPDVSKFSPIICKTTAYGSEAAIENAEARLDLFRCVLNIPSTLGNYIFFSNFQKPIANILPTPIYVVFGSDGKYINTFFTVEKFRYERETIKYDHIEPARYLLSKYISYSPKGSLLDHLLRTLRLYQKSLDTTLRESAFLTMWQVLENSMTFGEDRIDNKTIKSRIKFIAQLDPIYSSMLDILTEARNELVHEGSFTGDGSRLFFNLKLIADKLIMGMFSYAEKFATVSELSDFVSYSTLGKEDLQRKKNVIEKIETSRRRK